jgi:hypothetical protein
MVLYGFLRELQTEESAAPRVRAISAPFDVIDGADWFFKLAMKTV